MLCRSFRTVACLRSFRKNSAATAGLGHQNAACEDGLGQLHQSSEGLDDFESDFLDFDKTHKRYELEKHRQKIKIRQSVVKSKYFQETKLPNFLTYAEKDQIRLLHNRDAKHWSVEVLAESFPANCEIICKILKANWKPLSPKRILAHNVRVSKNWELFTRGGEMGVKLPEELKNHLKKFTQRREQTSNQKLLPNYPKNEKQTNPVEDFIKESLNEDKTFLDKEHAKKKLPVKGFKSIKEDVKFDIDHQLFSSITEPGNKDESFTLKEVEICDLEKKLVGGITTVVKDHIRIPRKKLWTGTVYRFEDSYYDDDGELLYRVPGYDL